MKTEKKCFKCGEVKSLSDFYRHKMMADGHVNKCKDCNKKDVKENRSKKAEYYRAYDRGRGNRQDVGYCAEYRRRYPNKARAHRMTKYHIDAGNLTKEPCEVCGSPENIHAHHDDYSKPLNVRWLCAVHHSQWHKDNGEGSNPR